MARAHAAVIAAEAGFRLRPTFASVLRQRADFPENRTAQQHMLRRVTKRVNLSLHRNV